MGAAGAAAAGPDAAPRRPVERPPAGNQRDPVADPDRSPVAGCAGLLRRLPHSARPASPLVGRWHGAAIRARLPTDSDTEAGAEGAVAIHYGGVRAQRHAAGARHAPPKDVPAERLAPLLPAPARSTAAGSTAAGS